RLREDGQRPLESRRVGRRAHRAETCGAARQPRRIHGGSHQCRVRSDVSRSPARRRHCPSKGPYPHSCWHSARSSTKRYGSHCSARLTNCALGSTRWSVIKIGSIMLPILHYYRAAAFGSRPFAFDGVPSWYSVLTFALDSIG